MANLLRGRCHCGNVSLAFETEKTPKSLEVRACGCSFCSARGARTTSDNAGRVTFRVRDANQLQRYRFGRMTADFLICRTCGAYLGAMFEDADGSTFATLNSRHFERADEFPESGRQVSYDAESVAEKIARRRKLWTPVAAFEVG